MDKVPQTGRAEPPSLGVLRNGLTEMQRCLLDRVWDHFCQTGEWILSRRLHRDFNRDEVVVQFSTLGGSVIAQDGFSESRYRLTLIGALLTTQGLALQKLLGRYFESQRRMFLSDPDKRQLSSSEIKAEWNLSDEETASLGRVVRLANLAGSWSDSGWSGNAMAEAESFPRTGSLNAELERWVLRFYDANTPVLESERAANLASSSLILSSAHRETNRPLFPRIEGDPLKRRYQVFVSSTFTDLIAERQHVMQALLETKCIPSGMELFPAASTEQWNLITQVIDDCDYYVVILAGMCGTIGPNGKSYTEMEYDYAVAQGKAVFGFFHSDVRKLPGERLEEDDHKRKLLAQFTRKVKSRRLCHAWNSPEGLASAIKTTILHAIESNPKPGWVRADSVPTWSLVTSLEERIANLEGRPNREKGDETTHSDEKIEIPLKVRWREVEDPKQRFGYFASSKLSFEKVVKVTLDEVLLHLGLAPGNSTNRLGLLRSLCHSLAATFEPEIRARAKKSVVAIDGGINSTLFDSILQTLLARKLLKHARPPKHVRSKALYWQLAPRGIERIAQLRAIRSQPN